ncbi:MAG TPA: NAD(P)-dependent oxidoreductase [Candidatus Baltobacteraceae bacterium]|jgi:nucleoside-diphosphate-sugar epimerase|nr:NAD(P)-dependent oxidoreductase [Candidatus Baltobacteraceae bacterium]
MKRILALGGAGFIGSYVVRELLASGYHVKVVDNFSKYGTLRHEFFDHPNFELEVKDVRNLYPRDFRGYDIVLCLAALIGGIRYFHKIPYRIARDNTELLTHAIDATLAAAPDALFVYFSSSMVYERMNRPVTESDALAQPVPLTNYGMQKLFGEFLTRGAREEFDLNYLIVRPFNAVGSGELPEMRSDGTVDFGMAHVIPDFVYKTLVRQTPFEIFGDGEQVRTFTHARDIASGLRQLLATDIRNDDFNFCGDNTLKMRDLAERIWSRINPELSFPDVLSMPVPPSDVRFRIGTSLKATERFGWKPSCNLDYIIDDTSHYIASRMRDVVRL